jgi:hypothetical protein
MRSMPVIIAAALAIGALSGVAAYENARPQRAGQGQDQAQGQVSGSMQGWREIAWPFPRDGWPAGRAFHCDAAACGEAVELYVRPKIGFCNCDSGVADDDEVDRVADLDLMSQRFSPLEPGQMIRVADMSGRVRRYDLRMADGSRHAAVGIAVSRRCDLLVAVAQGSGDAPKVQRAALAFLESIAVKKWMTAAMDGG